MRRAYASASYAFCLFLSCGKKVAGVRKSYAATLRSAASGGPICLASCAYDPDDQLIAAANQLPTFPFSIEYHYDDASGGFAGTTNPGVYFSVSNANNVREIRFYKDQEQDAFGVRSNSGQGNVNIFVDLTKLPSGPVRVELDTINGNTYTVRLPRIAPL